MTCFFTDKSIGIDKNELQKKVGEKKLIFMNQIHSDIVKVVDKNSPHTMMQTDSIISGDSDVALCVVVADCNPVIFYDSKKSVIGVAHAGRVGSFKGIVKKCILKMQEEFSCETKDIHVNIGPSIKKCCYEVGEEVITDLTHKYTFRWFSFAFSVRQNLGKPSCS